MQYDLAVTLLSKLYLLLIFYETQKKHRARELVFLKNHYLDASIFTKS